MALHTAEIRRVRQPSDCSLSKEALHELYRLEKAGEGVEQN
jgi:hypothetical protein